MKQNVKDWLQYGSAIALLIFGVALTIAGFIVDPLGIVDGSVLWVLGQTLLYAGGVFGISIFTKNEITSQIGKMTKK